MIQPREVPQYLQAELPDLSGNISTSPFRSMQLLQDYLRSKIADHNYDAVARCLNAAAVLYDAGNTVVRIAVQNVFVYSFANIFSYFPAEKKRVVPMIPGCLRRLYIYHLQEAGC